MTMAYSSNYGWVELETEEDWDFYHSTINDSVEKDCRTCGETVLIRSDYDICNKCADHVEQTGDF